MQEKHAIVERLTKTIQHNCHIADALHAGDYTLCVYLLKMRELYRWEQKETFSTQLGNETVGNWLRTREALWDTLEEEDYKNIQFSDINTSVFESKTINEALRSHKLVYSAGMGINNRPHFFIAELELHEQHEDYTLYISGKEYARDMSAPPAMSHDKTIYIRKESFRRYLWEQLETWRWNKPDNALGRAFACYDCESDLDNALISMTNVEIENVIQHERGEIQSGEILGEKWRELLFSLPHSKASIMLRAIRDHLADSLTTLPSLLALNSSPSWHFYFGNLTNMRKSLYPSLTKAYDEWHKTGSLSKMESTVKQGQVHWLSTCQHILEINSSNQSSLQKNIESVIEKSHL